MNFGHVRHLHFVGIGGVGMCGLAELLHGEGFTVSGCDLAASETTVRLESLGIRVHLGHAAGHLEGVQVLVISSAVKPDNAEVEAARRLGIPVIRRAEMLGEISRLKWGIAVAGTHGKTTTTSLTGFVLTRAGLDPTVVVGGRMHFLGAHARLGHSEYLVCEADEFDRSFLALFPVLAVLTTVEAEHLDTYGSLEAMDEAFVIFANRVPFYGATIACLDDPGVRGLLPRFERRIVTYGFSPEADVCGRAVRLTTAGSDCLVVVRGREVGRLTLSLPGRHTLANALGATAAALEVGVPFAAIAAAVGAFAGVARRFERKGTRGQVTLVDDYAHHPTEVAATLQAARQSFPDARLVAAFQPHLFSRTQMFAREFGDALLGADVVVVLPIYPAREQPIPGVTHEFVVEAARRSGHPNVRAATSFGQALTMLEESLRPGDVLLTLGAGNVVQLGETWLAGGTA
ncbi:MAG: UDP-N-acetylmuramate--L-alanine ligase [Acidobacteriia bacterium]|nr:UDP-N-acetylmuramate--L-alanine ligase [Terriglobia bacterium]